jgi:hypothetical protein
MIYNPPKQSLLKIMLYNQLTTHNCENVCTTCLYTVAMVTADTCAPCSCRGWSTLAVAAEVACTPPSLSLLRRKLPSLPDGHATVARSRGTRPGRMSIVVKHNMLKFRAFAMFLFFTFNKNVILKRSYFIPVPNRFQYTTLRGLRVMAVSSYCPTYCRLTVLFGN